ncbi:DUF6221 family protein [Streptomyces sp. NBC_00386]|uniref:DUF6221 family protein n=1 Tax=Streptomyces sp. NBC_00386 TaxID=2975734 RepID=UPI002E1ACEF1
MRPDDFAVMMEFFRARLRDDENTAHAVKPGKDEGTARLQARVLADVATKRQIMHWVEGHDWKAWKEEGGNLTIWQSVAADLVASIPLYLRRPVIYKLVAAYADHPDFRPEWLPLEDKREHDEKYEPGMHQNSTRRRHRTG